jgi:hypothetical protein
MAVFWDVAACSLVEIAASINMAMSDLTFLIRRASNVRTQSRVACPQSMKMAVFSNIAVRTSETLVNFYQTTRRNITED